MTSSIRLWANVKKPRRRVFFADLQIKSLATLISRAPASLSQNHVERGIGAHVPNPTFNVALDASLIAQIWRQRQFRKASGQSDVDSPKYDAGVGISGRPPSWQRPRWRGFRGKTVRIRRQDGWGVPNLSPAQYRVNARNRGWPRFELDLHKPLSTTDLPHF
jgi:hypothetical protein